MSSIKDRSTAINLGIKYGAIVLFLAALLNVYMAMRYRELRNKALESERSLQIYVTQQQAVERVLREFSLRASQDPTIMQIMRKAQRASEAARQKAAVDASASQSD